MCRAEIVEHMMTRIRPPFWVVSQLRLLPPQLAPGRYELRAEAPGFTCVAQPIRIGPGLAARSPFRVTLRFMLPVIAGRRRHVGGHVAEGRGIFNG